MRTGKKYGEAMEKLKTKHGVILRYVFRYRSGLHTHNKHIQQENSYEYYNNENNVYEHKIPRKQNLEHPEVRAESATVIVFNAKSRSTVELNLIAAFVVVISSKHGRRNLIRERQLAREHKLLIYLSQPSYLIVIFFGSF